jgi:hypothetical protein
LFIVVCEVSGLKLSGLLANQIEQIPSFLTLDETKNMVAIRKRSTRLFFLRQGKNAPPCAVNALCRSDECGLMIEAAKIWTFLGRNKSLRGCHPKRLRVPDIKSRRGARPSRLKIEPVTILPWSNFQDNLLDRN